MQRISSGKRTTSISTSCAGPLDRMGWDKSCAADQTLYGLPLLQGPRSQSTSVAQAPGGIHCSWLPLLRCGTEVGQRLEPLLTPSLRETAAPLARTHPPTGPGGPRRRLAALAPAMNGGLPGFRTPPLSVALT
jgi:hypothetical protein